MLGSRGGYSQTNWGHRVKCSSEAAFFSVDWEPSAAWFLNLQLGVWNTASSMHPWLPGLFHWSSKGWQSQDAMWHSQDAMWGRALWGNQAVITSEYLLSIRHHGKATRRCHDLALRFPRGLWREIRAKEFREHFTLSLEPRCLWGKWHGSCSREWTGLRKTGVWGWERSTQPGLTVLVDFSVAWQIAKRKKIF